MKITKNNIRKTNDFVEALQDFAVYLAAFITSTTLCAGLFKLVFLSLIFIF